MHCPNCATETSVQADMTPDGLVKKCAECGLLVRDDEAPQAAPVQPAKPTAPRHPQPKTAPTDPRALIKAARAELRERKRRVKSLTKELKAEQKAADELQRLLDAADGKSLAVVRPLRHSG